MANEPAAPDHAAPKVTEPSTPREAVEALAAADPKTAAKETTEQQRSAALDWYLSPEPESDASAVIPVNVALAGNEERIIDFTVQVIGMDDLRRIRRAAIDKDGRFDDGEFALQVCANSIIDPPIRTAAPAATEHPDPAERLKARLAHKPGLIEQISEQVLVISGWSSNDLKEVKAAGN